MKAEENMIGISRSFIEKVHAEVGEPCKVRYRVDPSPHGQDPWSAACHAGACGDAHAGLARDLGAATGSR